MRPLYQRLRHTATPLLRSFICKRYELRVTRRCLEEDLGRDPDSDFAELLDKATPEIVTALVKKRCDSPMDRSEIAPLSSGRTVYRLAFGDDHRGGTWHDERFGVVWLLAYRLHRSGKPDDAFPYIKGLDEAGRLLPTEADYKALFDDHGHRAAMVAPEEARSCWQRRARTRASRFAASSARPPESASSSRSLRRWRRPLSPSTCIRFRRLGSL
jgi:hypothetical protein